MTREGRAETREAKRTEQDNQKSKSGKAAGFSSTSQKGNIVHGKLKSQKELKKITGSEDYKKSDYEGKTKMLNVATAKKGLASRTHGSDKPNKEIGKQSFKKNFSFSGKQMSDHYKARKSRTQSVSRMNPVPYLTGGQAKIAAKAPPPNKIDEKDFAVLRAEKAKGRGMGLQDEKVKPGKVMKARVGKSIKTGKISDMSFDEKMKRVESGQINKKTGKFTSMNAMRDAKGFQKGESAADFNKRRNKIMKAAKIAKSTRVGKMLLPVVGAAIAAKTYLNSKMNKKKDGTPKKKMGGGMMQKPMGYSTGGPSAGYKSKEDRKKAEKNIKQARKKEGLRSFLSDAPKINQPMRKERYMEGRKARHSAFKKKLGRTAAGIASSLNPVTTAARVIGKVMGKGSKKRDFQKGDYGDISVKKMGGGMMQKPMGYRSGIMVKARGCKLGRTKPTKIT